MLTIPALRLYKNSEFIRYHKDVVEICTQKNHATTLGIGNQIAELMVTIAPLEQLFRRQRTHAATAEMVALDIRRDKAVTGIRTVAQGYALHFDATIAQAAYTILATIDNYGKNISRFNYMAETETLESLARNLTNNARLAAAVNTLGIQSWVTEMETSNQLFNDKYLARSASYASQPQHNLTQLRVVTEGKYEQLRAHIFSHHTLQPSTASAHLIDELNELTEQYNRVLTND